MSSRVGASVQVGRSIHIFIEQVKQIQKIVRSTVLTFWLHNDTQDSEKLNNRRALLVLGIPSLRPDMRCGHRPVLSSPKTQVVIGGV